MDIRGLKEAGPGRTVRTLAFATAFALTMAAVLLAITTGSAKANYTVDLGQYAPNGNDLRLGATSTFKAKKPRKRTFFMPVKLAQEVTVLTAEEIGANTTPSSLFPDVPELQGSQWVQTGLGDCTRASKSRVTCVGGVISSELAPNDRGTEFICAFRAAVYYPRAVKKTLKSKIIGNELTCDFASPPTR